MAGTRRLVAGGVLALAAVVGHGAPSGAVTALEAGWWTSAPVAVAPDGPPDALVVEGGVAEPRSYAAVAYTLSPGEQATSLTLRVAPATASTPGTTLALCPLREPFEPARGAPMAEAPGFDCATSVEAAASADGTTYQFDVTAVVGDGALAVAIVPTAPTDRVVLAWPGAGSLATTRAAAPRPGPATAPAASGAGSAAAPAAPALPSSPASAGTGSAPRSPAATPAPAAAGGGPAAAPTPTVSVQPVVATPAAQETGSGGASWLPRAVFLGLAAVAAALWRVGGSAAVVARP